MFSLEIRAPQERYDMLIAELWELGSCGITETSAGLQAFFEDDARKPELMRRFADLGPKAHEEGGRDWVEVSRAMWTPLEIGRRLFLVPDWRDDPVPPGRLRIRMNPGLACGSGFHEATQLCLEALERHIRPGAVVLDVGTGAGILSEAAALLGASRVAACDIDTEAIDVARARLAGQVSGVHIFHGSAHAVRTGTCDVAVANINASAAVELAKELWRTLRPAGILLLSGFERREVPGVNRAVSDLGPETFTKTEKGDWILIEVRKTGR